MAGWLVLCFSVATLGGLLTRTSVETWYRALDKPGFTPPDGVFGPVWTVLYALMAVAAWRVWRRGAVPGRAWALGLFMVQLALNLAWSALFFGMQWIGGALADIVLLLVAIGATALAFRRLDPLAGWLLLPYGLWVAYATVLNGAIWALN